MAMTFIPIEYYRTKFYQKENQSKRFQELTEEQLAQVANKIYRRQEINEELSTTYPKENYAKLERYNKILQYLTNPNIHMDIRTFDERLAFLIMSVDPYLITFKEFLKINIQSIQEIAKVENLKERNRLFEERNETLSLYEFRVREQLGFFDVKLLKYEELFFKRFYNEKELIQDVRKNNEDGFLLLASIVQSFDTITDERYAELVTKAELYISQMHHKPNSKTAIYNITNQKKLLGLNSFTEQLVFFILVIDSNLDMLRIYEEESMMPKVEERIYEEFGFYNKTMLTLETIYHDRFCPTKKLSIWSETK